MTQDQIDLVWRLRDDNNRLMDLLDRARYAPYPTRLRPEEGRRIRKVIQNNFRREREALMNCDHKFSDNTSSLSTAHKFKDETLCLLCYKWVPIE
jgi:hypothetical protein